MFGSHDAQSNKVLSPTLNSPSSSQTLYSKNWKFFERIGSQNTFGITKRVSTKQLSGNLSARFRYLFRNFTSSDIPITKPVTSAKFFKRKAILVFISCAAFLKLLHFLFGHLT